MISSVSAKAGYMTEYSRSRQAVGLVGWLLVTFVAAAVGSLASVEAGAFYAELERPAWAPPGWLFGPVWTLLYLMMAFAAWMVWRERGLLGGKAPLGLYLSQLIVNALWSWLFFVWQLGFSAFLDVLLLIVLITLMLVAFWRVRTGAGLLLIPYLLWVLFAAALNYTVWQLNPIQLG
jgi:translocator protein